MSLAHYNPEVSLLTPNQAAQLHVYSGGGRRMDELGVDLGALGSLKALGDRTFEEHIRYCTKEYTDMDNILCDIDDEDVDKIYDIFLGSEKFVEFLRMRGVSMEPVAEPVAVKGGRRSLRKSRSKRK